MAFMLPRRVRVVLLLLAVVGAAACKGKTATQEAAPTASAMPPAPKPVSLPPEPTPPAADHASEVPGLTAKLAADKAYAGVWSAPRPDLNAFLTYVSELLAQSAAPAELATTMKAKNLHDAGIKLLMIESRVGKFPDDFTQQFSKHLDSVKSEPHLGTWTPWKKGDPFHDFSALASWSRPADPVYLREHIAARGAGGGPIRWGEFAPKDKAPLRPWLVDERAALERLGLVATLTGEEQARLSSLVAEAAKPKAPRLGEDFKLGDFTYNVKSVDIVDSVGSGAAAKHASEDALFLLVKYTIRNDSTETETVATDDFRIVDAQSREFRPSADANAALVLSGSKDLALSELQPGLKKSMVTPFEMPAAAARGVVTLVIPEKGLLGTGSVRIPLK